MDKIITGFKDLAEEAGFSVSVCNDPDGLLLNFLVSSEHEDFGNTLIGAIAEKVSGHWQVVCTAYVFSTLYKEGEVIYQSSGSGECLDIKDVPAQLFKGASEVLDLVRGAVERGEIETSLNQSQPFVIEGGCIGASVFGKDMTISINPEFMKITECIEEVLLEEVFSSLNEMDRYELEDTFMNQDVVACAKEISSRVRGSYAAYCVSPTACECGGNNDWCDHCFGFGVYGDIHEEPLLVVVKEQQ